jgi:hypothetical protein
VSGYRLLHFPLAALALTAGLVYAIVLAPTPCAHAVGMTNDPKGFNNIPWGAALDGRPELTVANSTPHVKEYDLKNGPLTLGEAKVDMMRFSTFDGKFARVTIRYRGKQVHTQVLAYLQAQYGSIDRTPGQTMRGVNQQYNWRGTDTEINMTYTGQGERGFLFIESALLAPRFSDLLAEHGY